MTDSVPGSPSEFTPIDPSGSFEPAEQTTDPKRAAFLDVLAQLRTNYNAVQITDALHGLQTQRADRVTIEHVGLATVVGGNMLRANEDPAIPLAQRGEMTERYLNLAASVGNRRAFTQTVNELRDALSSVEVPQKADGLELGTRLAIQQTTGDTTLASLGFLFAPGLYTFAAAPDELSSSVLAGIDHANARMAALGGEHDPVASGLRKVQADLLPIAVLNGHPAIHLEIRDHVQSIADKLRFLNTAEPLTPTVMAAVHRGLAPDCIALLQAELASERSSAALSFDFQDLDAAVQARAEPRDP